jgi:DNA anti-recombination protein RmuC
MAGNQNGGPLDRGTRLLLSELRDLRLQMRADRQEDRRLREEDRRRAEEDRRRAEEDRHRYAEERRRSDERFERMFQEFRQDAGRREAATNKVFGELRTVGLAIVKTLNRHTRILEHHTGLLERIDRNLGARRNGPPPQGNGRRG